MVINTAIVKAAATSHWAAILAGILGIWHLISPVLGTVITAHPAISFWTSLAAMVAAFYIQPAVPVPPVVPVVAAAAKPA